MARCISRRNESVAEPVKAEVIDYLEGGVTAYGVKFKKYDMEKRLDAGSTASRMKTIDRLSLVGFGFE